MRKEERKNLHAKIRNIIGWEIKKPEV